MGPPAQCFQIPNSITSRSIQVITLTPARQERREASFPTAPVQLRQLQKTDKLQLYSSLRHILLSTKLHMYVYRTHALMHARTHACTHAHAHTHTGDFGVIFYIARIAHCTWKQISDYMVQHSRRRRIIQYVLIDALVPSLQSACTFSDTCTST